MLPIERQNRIKELIQVKHNMKISELSKELCVSEMTVHRDLKPLIDAGIVIKTFGGISLVTEYPHRETPKDRSEERRVGKEGRHREQRTTERDEGEAEGCV